jgi:hypothetical protein
MKNDRIISEDLGWTNDSEEIEMSKNYVISDAQQRKCIVLTKADLRCTQKKDTQQKILQI